MKAFRLLATSLLVALSMGFVSCGDDELEVIPIEIYPNGDAFADYGLDVKDYDCRGSNYMGNINYFSGLKGDHLWISSYDRTTKEKLWEWTDSRTFDRKRTVHLGYGEYKDIEISSIPMGLVPRTTYLWQVFALAVNHTANTIFCFKQQQVI